MPEQIFQIIAAEGEQNASRALAEAADVVILRKNPETETTMRFHPDFNVTLCNSTSISANSE